MAPISRLTQAMNDIVPEDEEESELAIEDVGENVQVRALLGMVPSSN